MAAEKQETCWVIFTRYIRSRFRPVVVILAVLCFWVLLFERYSHRSGSDTSNDPGLAQFHSHGAQLRQAGLPRTELSPTHGKGRSAGAQNGSLDKGHNSNNNLNGSAGKKQNSSNKYVNSSGFAAKEHEFEERKALYEKGCRAGFSGPTAPVYYYEPAKLGVCLVQKVGCTFWKRVFFYLYNDTEKGEVVNSPFDINRFYVHFVGGRKVKTAAYAAKKTMIDAFSKVLFVRDPWARVWSGYVDKFVLPDSWLDYGRTIMARRKDKAKKKFCADDIEFVEFLDFVINNNRDVHWKPVHKVCNPCTFHPDYLGKMESFSSDSNHILRKVGLERLIEGHDHAHYAEDEVQMLTKYHFRLYETRPGLRQCLKHSGVAERLWKAFVLNGYIDSETKFPSVEFKENLDKIPVTQTRAAGVKAAELLLKYHRNSKPMTSKQMRDYRRSVMIKHYRKAPRELLVKMADVFNGDFMMFNYTAKPADIFEPNP